MPLAFCQLCPLFENEFKGVDVLFVSHSTTEGKKSDNPRCPGATSDKHITQNSDYLENLSPGDPAPK